MSALYLGVDLGGTNVRTAVARIDGADVTLVGRDARATPQTGPDAVIAALIESARAALGAAGASIGDIAAAGLSSPGPLDPRTGVILTTQNIAGFVDSNFPIAERVANGLGGPAVFLDRDTVMAAIGEGTVGAGKGARDFVYLTVSTGVGGAIVSGGKMVRGASTTAGELGHFPVGFDRDVRCRCGSFGCVEAYAGGRNLAEAYGVADASIVYAKAASGDARASALIARAELALQNLAVGIVNALNPDRIVVGGSVAEHEPAHVIEPMRRAVAERAFKVPAAAVRIVPSALGADVSIIGSALAARDRAAGKGEWFL
ncbi:MAG TPA: ROK family protein [Candidatus Saccharimonadales bacterium]|nr:ROK family protein [Candidatus Saccharimonadales bacterium]